MLAEEVARSLDKVRQEGDAREKQQEVLPRDDEDDIKESGSEEEEVCCFSR